MRFVHCADLHLGTAFSGLKDDRSAAIRQEELCRSFLAIADRAKEADVLLVAGDLFDQGALDAETVRVLRQAFAAMPNTQVFIAAGNHDPLTQGSYYAVTDFPDNVHVFGHKLEKFTVAGCDIYGISFSATVQSEPLLPDFRAESGRASVLLMHANLAGADYNPISREQAASYGVSYLALGHVHSYAEETLGNTLCAYPGCPEGRGFDELGEKGIIIGEVTEAGVKTEFVPLCQRQYLELKVDITGLSTHDAVITRLKEEGLLEKDLYKVILTGETEFMPDTAILAEAFSQCFFIKFYDKTKRCVDPVSLSKESGVRGMLAEKLLSGLSGEQEELYQRALWFGLSALSGEKVKPL